jgi:predicted Holliday junction resolvase-like endonuclease
MDTVLLVVVLLLLVVILALRLQIAKLHKKVRQVLKPEVR